MIVRDAAEDDVEGILAIYNDVIATSTAVYRETPATLEDRLEWFRARQAQGYPVLVAAADDRGVRRLDHRSAQRDGGQPHHDQSIIGFASYGDFRAWPGYRFTVEHTVHVRADRRGHSVGTALMRPLITRAMEQGKHVMVGGIDAANEASLRFHERLGFERTALLREVGFKFGRWLDLVFVQRLLERV